MTVSVFKDLYKSTDVPFHVSIDKIIKRIKQGTSKELVELIRTGAKDQKTKLPCILFAGIFNERNSNSLQKHSGLMVVDFDKELRVLVQDLTDTMIDAPGAGLAAPQIGAVYFINNSIDRCDEFTTRFSQNICCRIIMMRACVINRAICNREEINRSCICRYKSCTRDKHCEH